MAHPITSSPFPSALDIAPLITSKISRDNFSIFDVVTGKIVRSGFAFVLDADPVHKARTISNPEITTAVGIGRRLGTSHMAIYPRFNSFFDFLTVAVTQRREEAIEATFASGFAVYFDATTRRTTTMRHNVTEE